MGVKSAENQMPCKALRLSDFKSAIGYLDGKTHPNHAFSRIAFSRVTTQSRFSIQMMSVTNRRSHHNSKRMLQENTTAPCLHDKEK
jgi:hypothetical protein